MPALKKYSAKTVFVLVVTLLSTVVLQAQDKAEVKLISVKAESNNEKQNTAYYYPDFRKGKVTFISGATSAGILNYNVANEYIEFITSTKDTLVFDDMYMVDMLSINSDTFYYDTKSTHLLKLLASINGRKLLVKESQSNHAPQTYYISQNSDYIQVTAPTLINLFPSHATTLTKYISDQHLELRSEKEIRQVMEYASKL